jgi:hypothetical protein
MFYVLHDGRSLFYLHTGLDFSTDVFCLKIQECAEKWFSPGRFDWSETFQALQSAFNEHRRFSRTF